MDNILEKVDEYNPKSKILIIFDNMIAIKLANKRLQPIVTKLNYIFYLFPYRNLILQDQKILQQTLHTTLL